MTPEDLKDFRGHMRQVARENLYLRRFMATKPNRNEIMRATWLATRREIEEALGYLWRIDRELTESSFAIGEMHDALTNVIDIMKRMTPAAPPPEPEPE